MASPPQCALHAVAGLGPAGRGAPITSSEKVGRVDAARPQERPQLAEPRGLDLADALAGQAETLAEAAVAAVSEAVMPGCEAVGPLKMAGDVVTDPVKLEGGVIELSDAPGLGARVDPESLARYRARI